MGAKLGSKWTPKRRAAYDKGLGKERAKRNATPLCFTIRSGYFCYNYLNGGSLYLGRDRDKAIERAKAKGINVYEKSDSQTVPETADVGPGGCEPFAASSVRPGWICCGCKHYTAWDDGPKCHHCGVYRCRGAVKPSAIEGQSWENPGQFRQQQHLAACTDKTPDKA